MDAEERFGCIVSFRPAVMGQVICAMHAQGEAGIRTRRLVAMEKLVDS